MTRSSTRRLRVALGSLIAVAALAVPAGALAGTSPELRPDLRMAKPTDHRLTVQTTEDGPNRRLLRFSATIINAGKGPFIVRGNRACGDPSCPLMTTEQRIRRQNGSVATVPSLATAEYDVGDGHHHWHVMDVERYELFPLDLPPEEALEATRGAKVGFCFFDTTRRNTSLPGAPQTPQWFESGCGQQSSTSIRVGLSVGWGDTYPWSIGRQWIDTTDLPYGRYLLCSTADGEGHWLETKEWNNQAWSEIELYNDGTDKIRLLSEGKSKCANELPPAPAGFWHKDLPRATWVPFDTGATLLCTITRNRPEGTH